MDSFQLIVAFAQLVVGSEVVRKFAYCLTSLAMPLDKVGSILWVLQIMTAHFRSLKRRD
jgi:hypothetical protein